MIKKKLAKMLTTCLMSVFIIGTASMTVHAESDLSRNIFTTTCAESDLLLQKMTLKI